jgi:SAM-dependent methyltransferase
VATDELVVPDLLPVPEPSDSLISTQALPMLSTLHCDPEALPFPEQSLDLVLLPHTLERAVDPHLALAEVARVLRPEGRVVIVGLNPTSAWALRQRGGRMRQGMGLKRSPLFLPPEGEFIGYWRARDWLRLLGFEIEHGQFGCWRLPVQSPTWLERLAWMDRLGEHWWPVLGASYIMVAVKRVPGMRLVGLKRRALKGQRAAAPAVAGRRALKE